MTNILKGVSIGGLGVGTWLLLDLTFFQSLLVTVVAYLVTGGCRFAKVVVMTLPRDAVYVLKPTLECKTFHNYVISSILYVDNKDRKVQFIILIVLNCKLQCGFNEYA